MNQKKVIENTIQFVKKELEHAEGGHDWFHIERVYKNALLISKEENVDPFIVSLGALLHDIADPKETINGSTFSSLEISSAFL